MRCSLRLREEATRCILAGAIVVPHSTVTEGTVVRVAVPAWRSLIELLQFDFEVLSTVPPRKLEEIVAAAYDRVGFDRVVLTPRSGDHGRDVIAEKDGWGTVRVIVQVKAYDAKNLVADEVRSLIGTYFMEPNATKAAPATTSGFAPRLKDAPNIAPLLGRDLLLLNGKQLVERLVQTEYSKSRPFVVFLTTSQTTRHAGYPRRKLHVSCRPYPCCTGIAKGLSSGTETTWSRSSLRPQSALRENQHISSPEASCRCSASARQEWSGLPTRPSR